MNWLEQVSSSLECRTGKFSSFEYRQHKLAKMIELIEEKRPGYTTSTATRTFSLKYVYDRIKCGNLLDGNIVAQAEALVNKILIENGLSSYLSVYASGTVATVSDTSALLNFGTQDPTLRISSPGIYKLSARVQYRFAGATFAASQEVVSKLRRTNNTAADISNSTTSIPTGITVTQTGLLAVVQIPICFYETERDDDIIQLFASVAALPSPGSLTATEASIIAERV